MSLLRRSEMVVICNEGCEGFRSLQERSSSFSLFSRRRLNGEKEREILSRQLRRPLSSFLGVTKREKKHILPLSTRVDISSSSSTSTCVSKSFLPSFSLRPTFLSSRERRSSPSLPSPPLGIASPFPQSRSSSSTASCRFPSPLSSSSLPQRHSPLKRFSSASTTPLFSPFSSSSFSILPRRCLSSKADPHKSSSSSPSSSSSSPLVSSSPSSPFLSSKEAEEEARDAANTLLHWLKLNVFPSSSSQSSSSSSQIEGVYTAWIEDLRKLSATPSPCAYRPEKLHLLSNYIKSRDAAEELLRRYRVGSACDEEENALEGEVEPHEEKRRKGTKDKKISRLHAAARAVGLAMPDEDVSGRKDLYLMKE
ncbi:hypothetical protein CSUI_008895 [Cystoisospora suis]|uniref:Uncharacterized protein n=1 Tax=Cystoisospora suis TaxID=483139 RepID=A0A2C6KLM4_9APIC|nr:hypothetical protein CSUI_008895 [Cystoisospora suis]